MAKEITSAVIPSATNAATRAMMMARFEELWLWWDVAAFRSCSGAMRVPDADVV